MLGVADYRLSLCSVSHRLLHGIYGWRVRLVFSSESCCLPAVVQECHQLVWSQPPTITLGLH